MKTSIIFASTILTLLAGAACAQPWRGGGDPIPMRDGSTIITVGGSCLVQYGRRNERINNAQRCSEDDLRDADRRMAGGGRPGFDGRPGDGRPGDGRPGYGGGGGLPYGTWSQSCRGGDIRGQIFQAECRNGDGRWNTTVLDMRNCPSGNAENRNGSLVCR